eukprot:967834-Pleurochrysis_carterae.AAC.1
MRATGSQYLTRDARALRKYACGASTKWKTVHVGQKEQRGATVSDRVHATRAKKSKMSRGQNSK